MVKIDHIEKKLRGGQSCRSTPSNALCTRSSPLYSMKPSFLNLFKKWLTRYRVVPTISASVSWPILVGIGSGRPSLPKFASNRRSRARRFSLELNN